MTTPVDNKNNTPPNVYTVPKENPPISSTIAYKNMENFYHALACDSVRTVYLKTRKH